MLLLCQPHNSMMSDTCVKGEMITLQVLLQGAKQMTVADCQIWTVWGRSAVS